MKPEIQIEISEEDKAELEKKRYTHPNPKARRRLEILYLKSLGLPNPQIFKLAGVSANTMRTCFRLYEMGGIKRLEQLEYHRPPSPLNAHIEEIKKAFEEAPPATVKEAQQRIVELTGIYRCKTLIGTFLKKTLAVLPKGWSNSSKGEPNGATRVCG
jgi:transposase